MLTTAIKEDKKKETEQAKIDAATKTTIELWRKGLYFERTFKKPKGKELVTRHIGAINNIVIQEIIAMFKEYIPSCQMMISDSKAQPKSDNVHIAYLTINRTCISLSWNKENPLSSLYQQLNGSNIYTEDKTEVELLSVSEDLTVRLD